MPKKEKEQPPPPDLAERLERIETLLAALRHNIEVIYERQNDLADSFAVFGAALMRDQLGDLAASMMRAMDEEEEEPAPMRRPPRRQGGWVLKPSARPPAKPRPAPKLDSLPEEDRALALGLLEEIEFDVEGLKKRGSALERALWMIDACSEIVPEGLRPPLISFLLMEVGGFRHPVNGVAAALARAKSYGETSVDKQKRYTLRPLGRQRLEQSG